MEYTITLPDSMNITSRGQDVTFDMRKLDPAMLAIAVQHGLTQKIADAAAGAAGSAALGELGNMEGLSSAMKKRKVGEWTSEEGNWMIIQNEAKRMMQVVADRLLEGDWGAVRTGGGGGVSPVVARARQLAVAIVKRGLVKRDGNAKAYTELAMVDKHAVADQVIAINADLMSQAQEELDAMKDATKALDLGDLGI